MKLKYQDMDSEEKLSFDRELKILKESDHPFIIKYIEEFLYLNG
jgi:serine/threonine protein kinase